MKFAEIDAHNNGDTEEGFAYLELSKTPRGLIENSRFITFQAKKVIVNSF